MIKLNLIEPTSAELQYCTLYYNLLGMYMRVSDKLLKRLRYDISCNKA